jgi:hypothetical protein
MFAVSTSLRHTHSYEYRLLSVRLAETSFEIE